mmetsp:Transcript_11498/g.36817  ORF Transcript_11498/g.36817 Transcript_11498/m.36817 type:complete len:360 (-) Transcript_11498:480-1559(-)
MLRAAKCGRLAAPATVRQGAAPRRVLASGAPSGASGAGAGPPPPTPNLRLACFGAGAAGGSLGGLVGLGGGAVMVPLMTSFAGMSQHAAVGTSSAAVAMTGICGWASFSCAGAVDLPAAAAVAVTAMLGARLGARLTARYSSVQLARVFAYYQLAVAPLVPLKSWLVKNRRGADPAPDTVEGALVLASGAPVADTGEGALANSAGALASDAVGAGRASEPANTGGWGGESDTGGGPRARELLLLSALGAGAGVASGLFGIGGGMVVTPGLCLLTDLPYTVVLGTTLAAMIPPSLVSAVTHSQMGNLAFAAALPLGIGAGLGAFAGGQIAVRVPEEPLQIFFTLFLAYMGGSKLRALRGK